MMPLFFFFQTVSIQLAFVALVAQVLVVFEDLTLFDHDLVVHQSVQELGEHDLFVDLFDQDLAIEESLPLNQCELWTCTDFSFEYL